MKIATLALTAFVGHAALAMHAPTPREQLRGADDIVEKAKMEADACVSNKLECKALMDKKGASSYVTVTDAPECEAVSEQDTETVGCYLKD